MGAIAIIGFSQLGWETSEAAADRAQEGANAAVVTALLPFCVAKVEQVSEKATRAKVRAEESALSRNELVMQASSATMGESKTLDNALAIACADRLRLSKPGA